MPLTDALSVKFGWPGASFWFEWRSSSRGPSGIVPEWLRFVIIVETVGPGRVL